MGAEENSWISFDDWKLKKDKPNWNPLYWLDIYWHRYVIMLYHDITYKIKRSIGRVIYGVSRQDVWGLDYFLAEVIFHGLCELQLCKHGYPATIDPKTGNYEFDEHRWNDILQKMIWGFNILYRCTNDELEWGANLTDEQQLKWIDFHQEYGSRFTTRAEEKLAYEAFDLLKIYFFALWD